MTGAGRGIGRAYAQLLAERGASVVVNDRGGSIEGDGTDAGPASEVAAAVGGVADTRDVATVEGAEALVATAVERFGRLDILINNAGIVRWAGFPEADADNLDAHLAVHVAGAFNTTRAAWPHMVEQGYGRIVQTTSTGMLGLPTNLSYATAKGGVLGMTRSLAVAGRKLGIKVNAIAPAAATRMGGDTDDAQMAPELVAPLVAYLAHESCPVSGEAYSAGAGRFQRFFIAVTEGWVDPKATIEDVAEHWAAINDEAGYEVPADLVRWSKAFRSHLDG
ncbi:MAG: NAD(P)-dependent dehydrogenase, short-chain alcohol dehydrogenase family [Actinomycetia bacterium]|nr:NAD(P)-dependent dehydrogenase, short-chain alcohol dehydrogenase family [Actinomycetes bacterium]